MQRYEFVSKFWEIARSGAEVTVRYGRIGTDGQTKTKVYGSAAAAAKEELKLVAEKTKKGYRLVGAPAPKPGSVKWTAATRSKLHGGRTTDPNDPPDAHRIPTPAQAWATLKPLAPTKVDATSRLQPAVKRILADFKSAKPFAFDPAIELYREICALAFVETPEGWEGWAYERAFVALWVAQGGMRATLELLLHATDELQIQGEVERGERALDLQDRPPEQVDIPNSFRHEVRFWWALRWLINNLPESEFVDANKLAHAARKALAADDLQGRELVAFAFSRDPEHALAELDRTWSCAEGEAFPTLLLIAAPTVASAKRGLKALETIYKTNPYSELYQYAFDLVDSFGKDAASILRLEASCAEKSRISSADRKYRLRPIHAALELVE